MENLLRNLTAAAVVGWSSIASASTVTWNFSATISYLTDNVNFNQTYSGQTISGSITADFNPAVFRQYVDENFKTFTYASYSGCSYYFNGECYDFRPATPPVVKSYTLITPLGTFGRAEGLESDSSFFSESQTAYEHYTSLQSDQLTSIYSNEDSDYRYYERRLLTLFGTYPTGGWTGEYSGLSPQTLNFEDIRVSTSCDGTSCTQKQDSYITMHAIITDFQQQQVPEPGTLGLLGAGLFALARTSRRRKLCSLTHD